MPELDIQSIVILLSGSSVLGWFLLISIPYFIVFPSLAWKYVTEKDKSLAVFLSNQEFKLDLRKRKFSVNQKISNQKRLIYFTYTLFGNTLLFYFLASPHAFFESLCFAIYLSMFFATIHQAQKNKFLSWKNFLASICISMKMWFYSIYSFFAYVLCWLLVTMFLLGPFKDMQSYKSNEIIEALITVFIVFSLASIFVMIDNSNHLSDSYSISLIFVLSSMLVLNNVDTVPGFVMKTYGWGNIENATILVDHRGCQVVQHMGIKVENRCSKSDSIYKFNGVYILSSIGKNYYLSFPQGNSQNKSKSIKFFLPSSNIASWARQDIVTP